jgi:hypothetical protein
MLNFVCHSCIKNRLFQVLLGITFLLFFTLPVHAQVKDSTAVPAKTKSDKSVHSPHKATIYSAILPGAGQFYNRKYWKPPIIYAALGGLIYSFVYNNNKYMDYRTAYKYRIDNDTTTIDKYVGIYSTTNLNTLQKEYHRYRDLSAIGILAVYVLNVVDANVDAQLYNFDVSDELSLRVRPMIINIAGTNRTGVSLKLTF